jgi:hypothetical protein
MEKRERGKCIGKKKNKGRKGRKGKERGSLCECRRRKQDKELKKKDR